MHRRPAHAKPAASAADVGAEAEAVLKRGIPVVVVLVVAAGWWVSRPRPIPSTPRAPMAMVEAARVQEPPQPPPLDPATPLDIPPDPGGFCEGPSGPDGYERPSAGAAVVEVLREELTRLAPEQHRCVELAAEAVDHAAETRSLSTAQAAVDCAPQLAGTHAVLGLLARRHGRPFLAVEALGEAVHRAPQVMPLRREFAEALAQTHAIDDALAQMQRYQKAEPNDWEAARRARLMEVQREVEHSFVEIADRAFPLRHDPALPREQIDALLESLRAGAPKAERLLGPLSDPVAVVVFRERADLLASTCAQGWAHAVFDGRLRFQAEAGGVMDRPEALRRVVAHELTHVVHRRNGARADGWLLEGLARYVAGEEDLGYARRRELMARTGGYIPFSSMMPPLMGLQAHEDSALAYDQSLMMVHWIVNDGGEDALQALLRIREGDGINALSKVMRLPPDELGSAFLRSLRADP